VVNCEHAHISEPHFDNVGDVKSGLEGTPPDIDGFIERTVRAVPESAKWLLKKTLKDRLGADSNHEGASEQVWRACAGKVWTSYERSHAAFLVAFVCNPEFFQKDATKYYLVEGFIRNWARIKSNVQTQALARGLLGLDGSPCPGAKELDERTKEKLGKLVETKPAN
jgi:hypothetical protein